MWFLKYLNKENEIYLKDRLKCFVFYEKSDTLKCGVHIHALIDSIDPKYSEIIDAKSKKFFGELSVVKPYDSSLGAAYYLAKKVGTEKLVNYEFRVIHSKVRGKP